MSDKHPTGKDQHSNEDLMRLEYQEAATQARFIIGIRFTYFAGFATVFGALMAAYYKVWVSNELRSPHKHMLLIGLSVFGLISLISAWIIERRNIELYRTCDDRAAKLEGAMGIKDGIRTILAQQGRRQYRLFTHRWAIGIFYGTVGIVWVALPTAESFGITR